MLKLGTDPANIRLGQDVLKTSWRRLEDVFSVTFFCLPRRLENVLKTSWRHNCKTSCKHVLKTSWKMSWRRLEDVLGRRIANTSWRRLEDVLEDEKCYTEDVLKTSWKTRNVSWEVAGWKPETVRRSHFRCSLKNDVFL